MPNIGILTSTQYGAPTTIFADYKSFFETGFGSPPTYASNSPYEAKGKYSSTGTIYNNLYRGVIQLQRGANSADIIVAVGGLVSAHAAVKESDSWFIVLVGRTPEDGDFALTDNPKYLGGVTLQQSNIQRRDALINHFSTPAAPITNNDVWLLYNPNSRMSRAEVREWRENGGRAVAAAVPVEIDPEGNDPFEFAAAFARLKHKGAKGVVISSDPFFSSRRDNLVTQANAAATTAGGLMKICYPFEIYGTVGNPGTPPNSVPAPGSAISIGPNLLAAYQTMGNKAAAIAADITAGRNPTFKSLDIQPLLNSPILY